MVQDYKFRQSRLDSRGRSSARKRSRNALLALIVIAALIAVGLVLWLRDAPAPAPEPTPSGDANVIPLAIPPQKPDTGVTAPAPAASDPSSSESAAPKAGEPQD